MVEPTHYVNIALIYTVESINDPGDGIAIPHVANVTIPPYRNQADIDAFVRHAIFDHTMQAITEDFDGNPFRLAILHQAARLMRLEQIIESMPGMDATLRAELREVISLPNDDAIQRWGGSPEG